MGILKVNEEQCIGCGACVAIDSEHFDFNDNGLSSVIKQDNLDSANLKSAMESCPTGAISIGDESCEGASCKNCTDKEACESTEEKCSCCENCTSEESCDCGCENCECDK